MTEVKTSFQSKSPAISKNTAYVVGVTTKGSKAILAETLVQTTSIAALDLSAIGAKATLEHTVRVAAGDGSIFLLVGIGDKTLTSEQLRKVSGASIRALSDFSNVVVGLPTDDSEEALAVLEGALIANYDFNAYKSKSKEAVSLKAITVLGKKHPTASSVGESVAVINAVNATRDLANTPPNDLYPQTLAAAFQKAAKGAGVAIEIWDEKRLATENMSGILAVGKGSIRPPRLIKIEYKPRGAKRHLALVGKGITFDSGGLTLKPGLGMLGMKMDMTGAATVGQAVLAIAALKLNVRVTAYLCVAENMPSGTATRPSDVIKYRNGKTVEVTNTDAEGRLVLADGLILASEQKPDLIVDVATLTGAARVALGVRYSGLMGNEAGVEILKEASTRSGELLWHMPLAEELRALLQSDTADMINSKLGNPTGSMMVGGLFLKEFVGTGENEGKDQLAWAHVDIAGSANNEVAPYGYLNKGATGVMLRTLVETAKALV
jgi:leucyl aminopeptidase